MQIKEINRITMKLPKTQLCIVPHRVYAMLQFKSTCCVLLHCPVLKKSHQTNKLCTLEHIREIKRYEILNVFYFCLFLKVAFRSFALDLTVSSEIIIFPRNEIHHDGLKNNSPN